jgi:predicted deacylase
VSLRKYEFVAAPSGPHLLVLGAIHGDEVCGSRALARLAREFEQGTCKLQRGRCTFVPVCNERAYAQNRRYVEQNLNRVILRYEDPQSYEQGLATEVAAMIEDCDVLLDLHSMQPEGDPFVFLNRPSPASEALCRALGMRWIMKGWPELYAAHPDKLSHCTQSYADRFGKPNALIECGTNGDPRADEVAYDATVRCLAHLGLLSVVDAQVTPGFTEPAMLTLTDLYFRDSPEDRFAKTWRNFEPVHAGEIIGYRADGQMPVSCPRTGFIVFPSPVSAVGTEWFYVAQGESP